MFSLSNMFPGGSAEVLRETTLNALRSVQAQVQTLWNKQHARDGGHGDVTATSLRANAYGATGIYTHTVVAAANDVVEIPPGVSFVEFVVSSSFGPMFTLRGIRQLGVVEGDMLWVRLAGPSATSMQFEYRAAASLPSTTEFSFPPQQASTADTNFFILTATASDGGACWVPFTYTKFGTDRLGWVMWQLMSGA